MKSGSSLPKISKSYLQYVRMITTFSEFVLAYTSAGPKAKKRFGLEERVRILKFNKK